MVKDPIKTFKLKTTPSQEVTFFLASPRFAIEASPLHTLLFDEPWSEESFTKLLQDETIVALGAQVMGAQVMGAQVMGAQVMGAEVMGAEIRNEDNQQDRAIGFILLRCAIGEADLVTLGVDPAYQGLGIGQTLCECAFEWIHKEKEIGSVFLEVDEENHSALRLYEKLRFEVVGRRKAYYTVKVNDSEGGSRKSDALIMRRDRACNAKMGTNFAKKDMLKQ